MSSVKRDAAGKIIEYGNFQSELDELTPAEVREIQAQEIEQEIAEQKKRGRIRRVKKVSAGKKAGK